jgi:hypothetical protein
MAACQVGRHHLVVALGVVGVAAAADEGPERVGGQAAAVVGVCVEVGVVARVVDPAHGRPAAPRHDRLGVVEFAGGAEAAPQVFGVVRAFGLA